MANLKGQEAQTEEPLSTSTYGKVGRATDSIADRTRRKVHYSTEDSGNSQPGSTSFPSQSEGTSSLKEVPASQSEAGKAPPGLIQPIQPGSTIFSSHGEGNLSEGKTASQSEAGVAPPGSMHAETAQPSSSLNAERSPQEGSPEAEPPPSTPVSPENSSGSVSHRLFASPQGHSLDASISDQSDSQSWNEVPPGSTIQPQRDVFQPPKTTTPTTEQKGKSKE